MRQAVVSCRVVSCRAASVRAAPRRTVVQVSGRARDLVYSVRNVDSFHFCKKSIVRADEMW